MVRLFQLCMSILINSPVKKPVIRGDRIEISQVIFMTILFDMRYYSGPKTFLFLSKMKEILENPEKYFS